MKIEKPLLKKNKKNIHGKSIYDTVKKNKKINKNIGWERAVEWQRVDGREKKNMNNGFNVKGLVVTEGRVLHLSFVHFKINVFINVFTISQHHLSDFHMNPTLIPICYPLFTICH